MKKVWERKSRLCNYEEILPELRAAIEKELARVNETLNITCCIQTESIQLKKMSLFDKGNQIQRVAAIVTPKWLVQAVDLGDKKNPPYAIFHYLTQMHTSFDTVEVGRQLEIEDYGVDVTSQTRTMHRRGTVFIGLEKGDASQEFIQCLEEAVKVANS